ncbi:MAG TPA: hypothetical protein VFO60_01455 [Candidatus Dormibacteraeota bacterium]|nr:hypothetical protein [Candidatus Dormibacteraeota bacterium]
MNRLRIVSLAGIMGIAGLMALPASSARADSVLTATGTADSSALTVSLNPEAIFSLTPATAALYQTLKPLTDALSGGQGLGSLSVSLDRSRALGSLTNTLTDLLSGHSDSAALSIDFHALDGVLAQLDAALKGLLAVGSPLSGILAQTPILGQLGAVTQLLNSNDPLTSLINALGVNLNASTSANYHNPPFPDVAHSVLSLVDLTKLTALPSALSLNLAPFEANAVPANLASGLNFAGPLVEAHNTTTSLGLLPTLGALPNLNLGSILSSLTSLDLSKLLGTVTSAIGAAPLGLPAVQNVLAGTPLAGLGQTLTTTTQSVGGTIQSVVNTTPLTNLQGVLSTTPLSSLQSMLSSLTGNLGLLNNLLGALPGLNGLIKTDGLTSTASLLPLAANTVQAVASTKLVDLDVLPLSLLGNNTSLLKVLGVSSSADTALSTGAMPAWKDATSSLSEIDVLGRQIVGPQGLLSVDQLLQGLQKPLDLTIPGIGALELLVTRGAPTRLDTPTERKSTISALEIKLSALGASSLLPFTSGFGANQASVTTKAASSTTILDVQIGSAAADVALNVPPAAAPGCTSNCTPATTPTAAAGPTLPRTGMFGPLAAIGAAGVAGIAVLFQLVPRIVGRRRRDG